MASLLALISSGLLTFSVFQIIKENYPTPNLLAIFLFSLMVFCFSFVAMLTVFVIILDRIKSL